MSVVHLYAIAPRQQTWLLYPDIHQVVYVFLVTYLHSFHAESQQPHEGF